MAFSNYGFPIAEKSGGLPRKTHLVTGEAREGH